MNKRCICETVECWVAGSADPVTLPTWADTDCPIHGLRDGVTRDGFPIAGSNHALIKYAREVTTSGCYVLLVGGEWLHWDYSTTRRETPAEVQRRLYREAVAT